MNDRFTVAGLLAELDEDESVAENDELLEVLSWFRSECAVAVADCSSEALPLRLPKGRISDLLACELGTIAGLGSTELSEPIVRGRLTDLLVGRHLSLPFIEPGGTSDSARGRSLIWNVGSAANVSGAAETGVRSEELAAELSEALLVAGEMEELAWLEEAAEDVRKRIFAHCVLVANGLSATWGEIPRRWWPRGQDRVEIAVADGVLMLAGQFDVVLGGSVTGRPAVVVEVKSGAASDRHRSDLLWYALLYALRYEQAPAVVATWTAADGGLVPVRVTVSAIESAARRGLAALERLVELANGRSPVATPHFGCRWCPELDRCEPGLTFLQAQALDAATVLA